MGYDDARTFQLGQVLDDDVLTDVVECRCGLVEKKDLRLSNQCTSYEYALALSARHTFAVDTDRGVHAKRELADVVIECSHTRSLPGIVISQLRVIEDDVVADGTLNELAVLHANANTILSQAAQVDVTQGVLVVEDGACLRMLQAHHQSHQGTLSAARVSDKGHIVTSVDAQVESVEQQRHVVGITELQTAYVHPARNVLDDIGLLPILSPCSKYGTAEPYLRQ